MPDTQTPSDAPWDMFGYLKTQSNWGRWGDDDEKGAINLITQHKIANAASLVRSGEVISLCREVLGEPGPHSTYPAQNWMVTSSPPNSGWAVDFYGFHYHGHEMTHLDAINHLWSVENGMWGGRDASREVDFRGIRWADVSKWRSGIVTRGVFLDIPRLRGEPYVTVDRPVQGSELYEAAQLAGVEVLPGDAVVVYCGREAWEAEGAGHEYVGAPEGKPGLDASCIPFIRETDLSLLMWDMADAEPNPYGTAATVHHVLWAFGVCLVDNCQLAPLAEACARKQQYEFMTSVSPIPVVGGTGSPVNPIAVM